MSLKLAVRLKSSAWYMCRLQVSMQRLETSWISKKAMPLRKIGLTITFEVNWHQKNYLKIILMCLVSYCDLEDFLGLETPAFCHVFLILVRRSVFL